MIGDGQVRAAAMAARVAAEALAKAMNEGHAAGVNFEIGVQFDNTKWVVVLTPFTRTPIKLDN